MGIWLAIIAAIAIAYFALKGRAIRLRQEFEKTLRRATERKTLPGESMQECATCGTYLAPAQQKNCGKDGCPYK